MKVSRARLFRSRGPYFQLGPFQLSLFLLFAAGLFLQGCASKHITRKAQLAITSDIISAASRATAQRAKIGVSTETRPAAAAASGGLPADDIYISLPLVDSSFEPALRQALLEVARRQGLIAAENSSPSGVRYDFFYRGERTHSVYLTIESGPHSASRFAVPASGPPRLAIIIDDLGEDLAAAKAVLALPFPLTVSILPHLRYSTEIAEDAARRGDQVLLHLPMESQDPRAKSESIELRPGMSQAQVETTLSGMLATVPQAAGVNNHEGSRATADSALMTELMSALRRRGLFFIDSRTSAGTVAYEVAERSGVPAASRKVFLDDNPARAYIGNQIELAARDAMRDGSAIAIGHPRKETIAALAEGIPRLQAHQIRLVFASDLAR